MTAADISEVTLVKHVTYLEKVLKLIKKTAVLGDNGGATYEVFLPEELGLNAAPPTPTLPTPTPTSIQKVGVGDVKKLGVGEGGNLLEKTGSYEDSKTLLKTNTKTIDDEEATAFSELNKTLSAAVVKITGKKVSKKEAEKWGDLADLLVLELEVAARRTGGVSSVPAFLTEVLRRQFFTVRQQPAGKSSKEIKKDTVGKSETGGSYEIKPLDEQGRKVALEQLQEWAGDNLLQDFEKWYTAEDWKWIMEQLNQ